MGRVSVLRVRRNECPSKRGTHPQNGSPQKGRFQRPALPRPLKRAQMQGGPPKAERDVLQVRRSEWQGGPTPQMGPFQQPVRTPPAAGHGGTGSVRKFSAVRWGVAGRIVWAWILTVPGSAAIGGGAYLLARAVGIPG